jgi:hypothetical protein
MSDRCRANVRPFAEAFSSNTGILLLKKSKNTILHHFPETAATVSPTMITH